MAIMGIDVGGTHTDGVIIENNEIIKKAKIITEHDNLSDTIIKLIEILTENIRHSDIDRITLSSTLTTNLILENKLSPTGLIISGGPGIKIDLFKKGKFTYVVDGAIDHRGRVLKRINVETVEFVIDELLANNVETVAVCSKFSIRNPIHERLLKERLESKFENVTMGHTLSGNLNFPRRINTAFLNSATFLKNREFINSILEFLKNYNFNCPVFILKADGGTISTEEAYSKPVYAVLSGSAAGVMGVMSLMKIKDESAVIIDIGGTSSDFTFFYNGEPLFEHNGIKIGDYLTLIRAIYSHSLGLGGDSYVRAENGEIKIGPERKDIAIAFGGKFLTTTDIVIFTENIENRYRDKIEQEINDISEKINLTVEEVCNEVLTVFSRTIKDFLKKLLEEINGKPIYTIKELVGYKEFSPKKVYIMGAPAESFKSFLSKGINLPVEVIREYEVVNAVGAAVSKPTEEINLFADTYAGKMSIPETEYLREIDTDFTLENCFSVLREHFGSKRFEITEQAEFNIISGFYRTGKTYRIKAQIKPEVEVFIN
jgi:N-methylhydantoinase A/oxoprolinase/acetone carboxylase beta subunit